jgi:hypothetical protein
MPAIGSVVDALGFLGELSCAAAVLAGATSGGGFNWNHAHPISADNPKFACCLPGAYRSSFLAILKAAKNQLSILYYLATPAEGAGASNLNSLQRLTALKASHVAKGLSSEVTNRPELPQVAAARERHRLARALGKAAPPMAMLAVRANERSARPVGRVS